MDKLRGQEGVTDDRKEDRDHVDASQLKAIRLSLGLTQSRFAEELGISRVFVGLMERGQRPITERTRLAALSLRPEAIDRNLEEFDPLFREVEASLLRHGVDFFRQFRSDDLVFDFYLPEFELAICLDREGVQAFRPTKDARGVIAAIGRNAIELLTLILDGRPLRAAKPFKSPIEI